MKIDIIFGGRSTEYDASINSYFSVIGSFKAHDIQDKIGRVFYLESEQCSLFKGEGIPFLASDLKKYVKQFDRTELISEIKKEKCFLFNLLHGNEGEDGCIQGAAEFFDIEGSFESTEVSSLTMNKFFCQKIVCSVIQDLNEIPTIRISEKVGVTKIETFVNESLSHSFVIKPNTLGASLFTSKFEKDSLDLRLSELTESFKFSKEFLLQEYIDGNEYTVGVVNTGHNIEILPIFSPKTSISFLGHEEKHKKGKIEAQILEKDTRLFQRLENVTRQIWDTLHLQYFARIDYIVTDSGDIYFLEVNSIPGLMKSSIFPKMLLGAGTTIPQMILGFSKIQKQVTHKNYRYEIE